ncbi:MAG: hypothetical protein J6D22_05410 [Pyramidobacter sp.]|nr:hypothetical protein [Pyramidobacter sp.]
MPGIISIHFGRLVSVKHKMKIYEDAKDWRDDLVGMSGVIEVIEASHNRQRIVFEINDYATVSMTSGSVEIKDGKLTANTHNTVYVFEIDTENSDAIRRAVYLKDAIDRVDVLLRSDCDQERAKRLLAILEELRDAVNSEFAPIK